MNLKVLETNRLTLRWVGVGDAEFVLTLLNEPSWFKYIGDRKVRTPEDARGYIERNLVAMYGEYGHGLFLVELKDDSIPIGLCGLIRRATLDDVDLGFAFLPQFWGSGYAFESAAAVMAYARESHGLKRIVAITVHHNHRCINLLKKLGFQFENNLTLEDDDEALELYAAAT